MSKPGVMFYFEFRPSLKRLSLEEKGLLLEAMLDYSEFGIQPELEGIVGVVWDFLQQKVDRDSARYARTVQQKQYANFVKNAIARGEKKPDFDTWLAMQNQQEAADSDIQDTALGSTAPADGSGCVQPVPDAAGCEQSVPDGTQTTYSKPQTTNHKLQTPYSKPQISNSKCLHTPHQSPPGTAVSDSFCPPGLGDVKSYCRRMGFTLDPESFFDYYSANGWRIGGNPMRDWQAALRQWNKKQKEKDHGQSEPDFPWIIGTHV